MFGYIVVISRNGSLGGRYPLTSTECLFGQSQSCDVRVHVNNVARRHCVITTTPDGKASIRNLSASNTTLLNSRPVGAETCILEHADVITVGDRHFRWEYPHSQVSPKMAHRISGESMLSGDSACMVQVFKSNKPRLSAPSASVSKVSEPSPKRRKTISSETDLSAESRPVNKRLLAVSQAHNSRRSLPVRVLVTNTSKRKSVIPARTPNRAKITPRLTKQSPKPTTPTLSLKSKTPLKQKSSLPTPLKTKTPQKIASPDIFSHSISETCTSVKSQTLKMNKTKPLSVKKNKPSMLGRKSLGSNLKVGEKLKNNFKRMSLPHKVVSSSLNRIVKNTLESKRNSNSPLNPRESSVTKKPRGRLTKTPQAMKSPPEYQVSEKTSVIQTPLRDELQKQSPSSSILNSPTKTPRGRPAKTPDVKGSSRKPTSPMKSPSPSRSVSPTKTPRGRPAKTPDVKGSSRKTSPMKSPSPSRSVSPTKTPRGRPAKTPDVKGSSRKTSPIKSPSPSRSVSTTKTPRGRPAKTPDVKGSSRKPTSPMKSPSPSRSVSPTKTPRGRPAKTPDVKGSSRKTSPIKSPSPSRSVSPTKTPRGRPAKTPDVKGSSRKTSPIKSPSPSRSVSPTKTPRGRPAKTPDVKGSSRKPTSPMKSPSPSRSVSPTKTPRGRPAKTLDVKGSSRKTSPMKSPSPSRSVSPTKTPRGRPAKTPDVKGSSRKTSPIKSPSPSRSVSPTKTPRGRPAKTPDVKGSSRKPTSPMKSPSPSRSVSATKTPRGRPAKTPDVKGSSRKTSPMKSPSPSRSVSPKKTPRGRPAKTPDVKGLSRKTSPMKSPSLSRSVSATKTPRGRPAKTPDVKGSSKKTSQMKSPSPSRSVSLTKTPRGRPAKTPDVKGSSKKTSQMKSPSPSRSVSLTKTPRGRPAKTPDVKGSSKKTSQMKSPSPSRSVSLTKTPRGRPAKTPDVKGSSRKTSPIKSPSPSRSVSPKKTPKGRPAKTPDVKGSSRKTSPIKSPSPSRSVSPTKTPRGRPAKTPDVKGSSRKTSPIKSPSPSRSVSPTKTPRGRPTKTPDVLASSRETSPINSPSPSRIVSPTKTPRGRPAKTPDVKSSSRKTSPIKSPSPSRSVSPTKTPRGRPTKTPDVLASSRETSPINSPSPSRIVSPTKTPRGRPAKTPDVKASSRVTSPMKSPSPSRSVAQSMTPRGRRSSSAASPDIKALSRNSSLSKHVSLSFTLSLEDISLEPNSVTSITPSKIKTPSVSLQRSSTADNFGKGSRYGVEGGLLLTTPTSGRLLRSDSPAISQTDLSDKASQSSSNTSVMRFTATMRPRHNRASILRTSLHHDSALLQEMADMFSGDDGAYAAKSPAPKSRFSSSASSLSAAKTDMSNVQSGAKRKTEDSEAEARAEKAAKRLKMETPKSLSKNKVAALLACHSRSPKSAKKQPLFSEVLKHQLTAAKQRQTAVPTSKPALQRRPKPKPFQPALEVPKSFNFNSTGHANSPETVVIKKPLRGTPAPKPSSNSKQARSYSLSRQESLKTPSKGTVSSLKTASSAKKGQSMKVRFSLHNEVQSPSGKRISIKQTEPDLYLGSPIVLTKRYYSTPKRSRISETSMLHTSIKEESPLAQEDSSATLSSAGSSGRKNSASKKQPRDSYDFSVYSPSSPTLQFSEISGVSSQFARKSIDFSDFSPVSDSSESPKRKRSMPSLNSTTQTVPSGQKFSFAGRRSGSMSKSAPSQFQPSPDNNARLSSSDLFGSSFESTIGKSTRASRVSSGSVNTSGVFKMSPNTSLSSVKSSINTSRVLEESVSQIPLPPSPYVSRSIIKSEKTESPIKSVGSIRSTRTSMNGTVNTPKSVKSRRSKSETLSLSDSKIVVSESPQVRKRISSTPKPKKSVTPSQSPITSPILSTGKRSFRSRLSVSTEDPLSVTVEGATVSTPQSIGKRGRKSSTRMTASNSGLLSPETQVPILAVKPSTRKKQLNESVSVLTESVSLSNLSVSQDVSGRSIDRNLAQKLLDSRASTSFSRRSGNSTPSSVLLHDLSVSPSSSGSRKRKSSASTNSLTDATTFDFNSVLTPRVPRGVFVSPLDDKANLSNLSGMKRVLNPTGNSPVSTYTDVRGVKRLLRTPQPPTPIANYASVEGIKRLFKQSPVANYGDVSGLNLLYQLSTSDTNYMNVKGVRRTPNSSDVAGVEVLFESPKKTVETFIKQSPQKPVGMVPPMSRPSMAMNDDVVDLTEPVMSGSRSRRTTNKPEETVTSSKSRKTRQTIANSVVIEEHSFNQLPEVKTRAAKGTETGAGKVQSSTKGRKTRGERQVEEDDSDVEIVEPNPEIITKNVGKVTKKELAESKRKLSILDLTEPPGAVTNKRTRGRNLVTDDQIPEVIKTKSPKTKKSLQIQDEVLETSQKVELSTKKGGRRKLRGAPESPLQEKGRSPKAMLGKRGKPSNVESTNAHSPPKKARRGKQAQVEVVAVIPEQIVTKKEVTKSKRKEQSNDVADNDVLIEPAAKAGKAVASTSRSRRGKAVTVSPVKVKTPSPIKPRSRKVKQSNDVTVEDIPVENAATTMAGKAVASTSRSRRGKAVTVSPIKVKTPSPIKPRSRKVKQSNDVTVEDVPVETAATTMAGKAVASKSRSTRGKAGTVTPVKVKTPSPIKPSVKVRKGKHDKSLESSELVQIESPKPKRRARRGEVEEMPKSQVSVSSTVIEKSPVRGRGRRTQLRTETSKPEESVKSARSVRGKADAVAKSTRKETIVEEVENEPQPKRGSRQVKSQVSPKKSAKGKGKKGEVASAKKSPLEVNKRRKEENLIESKPSTSRQKQEEKQLSTKASRRVQFNSCDKVYSITPKHRKCKGRPVRVTPKQQEKAPKSTVKTKPAPKLKAAPTRKSKSPKKSSPPKRVTRARK